MIYIVIQNFIATFIIAYQSKAVFANVSKINLQYVLLLFDLVNKENVMNQNIKLLTLAIISTMGISACSGSSDNSTPVSVGGGE
ncbi:hypothetical protein A6A20_12035 [Volucribacter amazonae]|uniref:Uncharacterized protein n=1 Tax=Volucribacter amazonae TaxID=256731 RepID=A0A9X4PEW9_9PAST|nr:hypothetical protein [Volucribacter amazonae]